VAILANYEFRDARVAAGNPLNGLAILETGGPAVAHAIFRTGSIAEGEAASAISYPVVEGLFMPLEVAQGLVHSATGAGRIEGALAIFTTPDSQTAGGPIVDRSGDVIGITVRRLHASSPSNVEFGISSELILKFLASASVDFSTREIAGMADVTTQRSTASDPGDYTVPVLCFR
jgi:hypothetical protein